MKTIIKRTWQWFLSLIICFLIMPPYCFYKSSVAILTGEFDDMKWWKI